MSPPRRLTYDELRTRSLKDSFLIGKLLAEATHLDSSIFEEQDLVQRCAEARELYEKMRDCKDVDCKHCNQLPKV